MAEITEAEASQTVVKHHT